MVRLTITQLDRNAMLMQAISLKELLSVVFFVVKDHIYRVYRLYNPFL